MKFTFLTGIPYTFYAESTAGEMRYTIGLYQGKEKPEEVIEVTPETWDRLLRAQKIEHLNTVAVALDGDHAVGNGQLPTIARCLAAIAEDDGEVVFDGSDKPASEVEPS